MKECLVPILLLVSLSANAFAQGQEEEATGPTRSPWGLGVAAAVSESPYAGEGTRVIPLPLISYQGERFYFRGVTAGWTLMSSRGLDLSVVAKPRLDGFDVSDLGRAELAHNGVDIDLLEDRDNGLDAGFAVDWKGKAGAMELEVLTDVSDAGGGQEVLVQYGYPVQLWMGILTPTVAARWLSEDTANYYYGTLQSEAARGVVDYKPGSVTVPRVGLSYLRPLNPKWSLIASLQYEFLPSEIQQSPFIDADAEGSATMFIGISRGFQAWWMGRR